MPTAHSVSKLLSPNSFLHVPFQSGSDSVSGEKKQDYCVKTLKKSSVFQLRLLKILSKQWRFAKNTNLDRFLSIAHPEKPAANMKRIPVNQVEQRTKRLTDLFYSYEPYTNQVNMKTKFSLRKSHTTRNILSVTINSMSKFHCQLNYLCHANTIQVSSEILKLLSLKKAHHMQRGEPTWLIGLALIKTSKYDQYSNLHNFFSSEARIVIKEIKIH